MHHVPISKVSQDSPLWVQMGIYRRDTMTRLGCVSLDNQVCLGDRVLLKKLTD